MSLSADQSAEIRGHVHASLMKRAVGVTYGYDVSFMAAQVQSPQGPRVVPVYVLLITRPSPLIGQPPLSHIAQIPSSRPTTEQVDEQVADGIRLLAALHAELKRPPAAPPAGQPVPPRALANGRRS